MPPEIHGVRRRLSVARSGGHPLYPLLHLITYTGLLRGESLALRWDNVALEGRYIHIVESDVKTLRQGGVVGRTKTGKSVRTVDLDPNTVEVLTGHRNRQSSIKGSAPALVFPGLAGKVLRPATILKQIKKLGAKAGVPDITFHSLRHFHATVSLQKQQNPLMVSRRLGHANVSITMETYGHVMRDGRDP